MDVDAYFGNIRIFFQVQGRTKNNFVFRRIVKQIFGSTKSVYGPDFIPSGCSAVQFDCGDGKSCVPKTVRLIVSALYWNNCNYLKDLGHH